MILCEQTKAVSWIFFHSIIYNHQRKISCTPRNFLKGNFTMLRVRLVPFVSAFDLPTSAHIDCTHTCPRMDGYFIVDERERSGGAPSRAHSQKNHRHMCERIISFFYYKRGSSSISGAGFDLWHMNQKLIRLCAAKNQTLKDDSIRRVINYHCVIYWLPHAVSTQFSQCGMNQ